MWPQVPVDTGWLAIASCSCAAVGHVGIPGPVQMNLREALRTEQHA